MAEDTTLMHDESVFQDSVFTIIPSPEIDVEQTTDDLVNNGGKVVPFDKNSGRIKNLSEITHIISSTSDFPDYNAALDKFIHVVKPSWVAASIRKFKAQNPRGYSPDPALFMSGVTVCIGDLPDGDKQAIIGGVVALGGQYSNVLSKMVTHLVALDLQSDPKAQLAIQKRLKCCILVPHWFDDCLKLRRRISEKPYILPDPEVMDLEPKIPLGKVSSHVKHASTPNPSEVPAPSEYDSVTISPFKHKSVMLGQDLKLNDRLKGVIEGLISAGGGKVVDSVDAADLFVCNYRDGPEYIKASQNKLDVGNLSWLYYMIAHNTWTDPMRRLLHYPRPREGIPGFKSYKISISSYSGEARIYLENLVKATGAEFTKTFKQDNTHLIAAHIHSEKCEAAKEWGVNLVNHLWLEESYALCKEQTLTDPKYSHFPKATNLGEVLGHTEIDRAAVERMFFPTPPSSRKLKSGRQTDKEVEAPAKLAPAAEELPTAENEEPEPQPKPREVAGSSAPVVPVVNEPVAKATPKPPKTKRAKTGPAVETPSNTRAADGKENETPWTSASRGAKDRAQSKLHEAAADIALYEKESKRKGGVVYGGRREKEPEAEKARKGGHRESAGSKRSFSEAHEDEDASAEEVEEEARPARRGKKAKMTPIKYRMLVSKTDRWLNNPKKESEEKSKLRELGVFIIDDSRKVDLLCAPKFVRTKKFVSALAQAPTLVSISYMDDALKHNRLPSPDDHVLVDHAFEKEYGFKMTDALERARNNKGRLLKNWAIFCTDEVIGGYDTFKDIIAANGGTCHLWKGSKNAVSVSKRTINREATEEYTQNQTEDEEDVLYLLAVGKKSEFPLWKKFRDLAKKHDMIPRIVSTDWILFVAMAQYIHWDPKWELTEEWVLDKTK